ncbi:MAG: large-conductance mechanosensitive channel protein MscL [Planctomycetota bacterium]
MGFVKEFKDFAMRGNVMDMAIGIIIGGAFGKIVSSFVANVMMPPLGVLMGGVDFSDKEIVLKAAETGADGTEIPAVTLGYGIFINTVIDFVIVAFAIFLLVKAMNAAKKKEEAAPAAPPAPSKEEVLLGEIRDILKAKA